jgi:hypothetical protein
VQAATKWDRRALQKETKIFKITEKKDADPTNTQGKKEDDGKESRNRRYAQTRVQRAPIGIRPA